MGVEVWEGRKVKPMTSSVGDNGSPVRTGSVHVKPASCPVQGGAGRSETTVLQQNRGIFIICCLYRI